MHGLPVISSPRSIRWLLAAAVTAGSLSSVPQAFARAADEPTHDVENAKQNFYGQVTAPTLVFSGAGANFYPTQRLDKGAQVVVAGMKGNWLKIVPPDGSVSYIPQAFVQRYNTGNQGKVNSQATVRAGSSLQRVKWAAQTKLDPKEDVTILGEEDEYYKIKPPASAFLYISKDAVVPVAPVTPGGGEIAVQENNTAKVPAADTATQGNGGTTTLTPLPGEVKSLSSPSTRGAELAASSVTTRPSDAEALAELQKLEADFGDISKRPLTEQPVDDLLTGYQKLAGTPSIPEATRRIAEVRIATLRVRAESRQQFLAVQQQQAKLQEQIKARDGEREELEQRIKELDVRVYAAVGTLRPSSLQISKTMLYRLTDPATGRTVVYLWGNDPKLGEQTGQFVGVKGEITSDPRLNLKVVNPTAVESVDPAKMNTSVAAEIVPASLVPKATPTASAAEQPQQ